MNTNLLKRVLTLINGNRLHKPELFPLYRCKENKLSNKLKFKTMQYIVEKSLADFDFWSGAKETRDQLTNAQMEQIESLLEECYPEGITETQINDIFWFESDWLAKMLGFRSWADLIGEDPEYDEEEPEEEEPEEEEPEEEE